MFFGEWLVATVYLYAQWFHYTRQSYGISRMYLRKAGGRPRVARLRARWRHLRRCRSGASSVDPISTRIIPQPADLHISGSLGCALRRRNRGHHQRGPLDCPRGAIFGRRRPDAPHSAYIASHIAIFAAGYLLIDDINTGWLVLNIWHNLQYVLIVWMFNANRFGKGVEPERRFLSTISQPRNVVLYALVCWAIGTALYFNIDGVLGLFSHTVLPLSLLAYMTINFHHYVVDAIIWRRPRRAAPAADVPV